MASARPTASARRASGVRPPSLLPRSSGVRTRTRPGDAVAPLREELPLACVKPTSGFVALLGALEELDRPGRHDGGNGVLVDELRMCIPSQQDREIVEPSHAALQPDAVHQKDRHRHLVLADVVQEDILNVLGFFSSHRLPLFVACYRGPLILLGSAFGGPVRYAGAESGICPMTLTIDRYHNSRPGETQS